MNADPKEISVNGVVVDVSDGTTPGLGAARELLRQRAVALGVLAADAKGDAVIAGIEQLLNSEVETPSPSEEECRRYYDAHPDAFRSGDLVYARHILFQITPGSRLDLIRAQAEETLAQVVGAPDEFEACALTLSNCPSGLQGGNLGQISRGDMVPEFEQVLFADGWIGILPRLVKTRYGFHIVSIDRRIEGQLLPFDIVRQKIAEHLAARVQQVALRQYIRLLAGEAELRGVDLDAAPSPLMQ